MRNVHVHNRLFLSPPFVIASTLYEMPVHVNIYVLCCTNMQKGRQSHFFLLTAMTEFDKHPQAKVQAIGNGSHATSIDGFQM